MLLLAGGAGYIGSHTALHLKERGVPFAVYDNLIRGHRESALGWEIVEGDLSDSNRLGRVMKDLKVDAVVHLCAFALVPESMRNPHMYYANNLANGVSLLKAMLETGVRHIVFSSSCAVYGEPDAEFISEDLPLAPVNPYGETKRAFEVMLDWYGRAYGLRSVRLRYFNAAGADEKGRIGESHDPETHIIPLALKAAKGALESVKIFGTDYPTHDGTCVRDYIHVTDLAEAHLLACDYLRAGGPTAAFNLGYGRGHSVREVVDTCRKVSGSDIRVEEAPRRPGDPPRLVADNRRFKAAFPSLEFEYDDLEKIISTAWKWETNRRY